MMIHLPQRLFLLCSLGFTNAPPEIFNFIQSIINQVVE